MRSASTMEVTAEGASGAVSDNTILCLLNPAAHSAAAAHARDRLAQAFDQSDARVRIEMPSDSKVMEQLAREAVQAGAKLVVAGGGDGTMNAVANALANSKTALGVLPLGTLNHFARDLGVPLDLDAAVTNVFAGQHRVVDVGEVNGRVFVNNSSIGLYPEIVREREALQEDGESKWVAFARASVAVVQNSSAMRVRMQTSQRVLNLKTRFIFVGNNEYALAPPRIGVRLRLDGSELWVVQLPHAGRFRSLGTALRDLFAVGKPKAPLAFTTKELQISTAKHSIDVALDGEVRRLANPLLYRSRPRALHVIVPRTT